MKNSDFQQLNIVFAEHDRVWCYCIYHKDTVRPNLSVSLLDKYYGRYKCWACGRDGRLTKEQMDKLNLSTLTIYKNNESNLNTRWKQFTESCYDNLQKFPLLKLGLAKQLNISTRSLDDWLVGYDGTSFTVPMFREDLSEYYRESGTCGAQRRFPDGTKRCVTGSRLGLMYPYEMVGDYQYVFVCEGFSDGISVWDLGLQSIARPHCRHTDGIREFFNDVGESVENIVIIPDNDTMGMEGAERLKDELSGLYFDDDEWGDILRECTIFSFDSKVKDIREYIAKVGKHQAKKELERYI